MENSRHRRDGTVVGVPAAAARGRVAPMVVATSPAHSGMAETMLKRIQQKNGGRACVNCDVQKVYSKLELCLADSERDWAKCQNELKAFKKCFDSCMK